MNSLVKELIRPLLEDSQKVTAVYGGGFKPPIKGHFNLVKQALKDLPEIDDFIIYVGGGVRDGITQEQSMEIWGVYQEVLGSKVQIEPSAQPIRDVIRYAKDHPDEKVYFVIGYREGREDDLQDIASRTKGVEEKYPNLEVKVISTSDPEVSGTNARKAASKGDKEKFMTFLPDEIPPGEKEEIYNIVDKAILKEVDPKVGTGKKPKGSGRRLYTDEDPSDTVSVKFSTKQDIIDTLSKASFKSKSHARQSQIINLIHQRVRAAYERAKDPDVKKRLKTALEYAEQRKEASKAKTQRLKKENVAPNHTGKAAPYGSGYDKVEEKSGFGGRTRYRAIEKRGDKYYYIQDNPFSPGIRQEFGPYKTKAQAKKKMETFPPSQNYRDITENTIPSINILEKIAELTNYMIDKGYNIEPLPGLTLIDDDISNAEDFFGKTAYYDPNEQLIVLYTHGRHPKDIARSYAHEMIHHIQNLEGRLGNITTTNTQEDDHLNNIEAEANLKGTMTFRNWTDSLQEDGQKTSIKNMDDYKKQNNPSGKVKDPFGLNQYARELAMGLEEEESPKPKKYTIFCDMDGVLVDFDEGYKQLTGMSTHHVDAQGKKEFWKAFRQGLEDKDISEESYWANLDWQPGGKELWDYIAPYKPYVLTAPAVNFDLPDNQRYSQEYNESMKGKLNWVQRLPNMRKIYFAAAKNKPKFARPNNILIDDRKDTIDAWNANGGVGILYTSAQQVIDDLQKLGL